MGELRFCFELATLIVEFTRRIEKLVGPAICFGSTKGP